MLINVIRIHILYIIFKIERINKIRINNNKIYLIKKIINNEEIKYLEERKIYNFIKEIKEDDFNYIEVLKKV